MDWIKKNYDKVALGAVAIVCLTFCALSISWVFSFSTFFAERNSPKTPNQQIGSAELADLMTGMKKLESIDKWNTYESSLFASRIYIFKNGELIDPMEGDRPLHPPIPNAWLLKHDLDYSQSDVLNTDPDGDGFTVLEEWKAGTSPTDTKSIPPYWTKLRLQEFEKIPFKVKFNGSPDGGETFTINFIDDRSQATKYLPLKEEVKIAGVPYTLSKYTPKTIMVNDIEKEVSELTLEDKATGQKIVLIQNQIVDSPTTFAVFFNELDGQSLKKVKKGDTFSLPQAPEVKYVLQEIYDDKAIISKETGEKVEIPRK